MQSCLRKVSDGRTQHTERAARNEGETLGRLYDSSNRRSYAATTPKLSGASGGGLVLDARSPRRELADIPQLVAAGGVQCLAGSRVVFQGFDALKVINDYDSLAEEYMARAVKVTAHAYSIFPDTRAARSHTASAHVRAPGRQPVLWRQGGHHRRSTITQRATLARRSPTYLREIGQSYADAGDMA